MKTPPKDAWQSDNGSDVVESQIFEDEWPESEPSTEQKKKDLEIGEDKDINKDISEVFSQSQTLAK